MRLLRSIGTFFGFGGGQLAGGPGAWARDGWAASAGAVWGRETGAGEVVNTVTAAALPAVYRACSFIADSLASVELRIVQEQPDGGKIEVADTDASRALADWSYEQREMFLFHAALGGNGHAVLQRNSRNGVQQITSVMPRFVMAAVDEVGALFYAVGGPTGPVAGEPQIVPQDNMLHLRFRHIGDSRGLNVFGVPPVVTAAEQLGLVLAARSFQSALWRHGSLPIGYLKCDKMLKQPVIDRLTAQWNDFYRGASFAGRTAVLEEGLEWHPIKPGVIGSDSDIVNNNRFGVEEVGRLYSLPASVLGQTGNASYSTATEEYRAAVLHCLRPWAARFTDCLSRALLTRQQRASGIRVEAPLDHLLVAPGKEWAEYAAQLVNNGVCSVNEMRNSMGLPDVSGGDVLRCPVNTTDIRNLPKIGLPSQPKPEGQ